MDINYIVTSNITRETPVATLPGFGVHAILAQFATSKTATLFPRHRYYSAPSELLDDSFAATDSVYLAAVAAFSQNPRPERIMVGRIDPGDASVAASGDAIRAEQDDWYTFEVVGSRSIKFVLGSDLSTGNVLSSTINGTTVAPVTYATSHANTMSLWKAAIEAAITGATATISGREMTVTLVGKDMNIGTASVAGGTAVTITISYPLDATKTKAWMAWAETVVKDMGFQDSDPAWYAVNTGNSSTAGLMEYAKLMGYKRVFGVYHATNTEYLLAAWVGAELPRDVGEKIWAFTKLAGVSPDNLTTSQVTNILAKNGNFYTSTATYSHTYAGLQADGVQIDQVRGLDWLNSNIKVANFNLMSSTKVTITDSGYQLVYGVTRGELTKAERQGVLVPGSSEVTVPLASSVSAADKAAGIMSGTKWNGVLQVGALRILINGTVSV